MMGLHYILLLVLIFLMFCYLQNGHTLQCYGCNAFGPSSDLNCNGTIRNCSSDQQFCNIYRSKGRDNISDFTRACVGEMVCEPNYCRDTIIGQYGKVECSISCCKENLCNGNDIVNTASGRQLAHLLQTSLIILFVLVYAR